MNPDAPEAQEFLKIKREEAMIDVRLRLANKKKQLALLDVEDETNKTNDNVESMTINDNADDMNATLN